jgi:hypothetical protein
LEGEPALNRFGLISLFLPLIRQLAEDVFNVTCIYFSYRLQVETAFYYLNASGFWKRLKVIRVTVKPYFLFR